MKINVIDKAMKEKRTTLSEYESKEVLSHYGIPITKENLAYNVKQCRSGVREIGFPVVMKGCSPNIAHKSEYGLIIMDIWSMKEAEAAFEEIMAKMSDKGSAVLIQEMVRGKRELVAGLTRDDHFGPCIMFGIGGIFTEILADVTFRMAPFGKKEAINMTREIRGYKILEKVRGMEAVDLEILSDILIKLGMIGIEHPEIKEIDINPMIISGCTPIAVDALVVLSST